jgi:hypothetical protein
MLNFDPTEFKIRSNTKLMQMDNNSQFNQELRMLVEKQNQSGRFLRRTMTLVVFCGVLISTWVYGPELIAIAVDRYQKKSLSLAADRLHCQMAIRSRAMLPLVEASENAASQYLQGAPRWQLPIVAGLKIARSALIVASQLHRPY